MPRANRSTEWVLAEMALCQRQAMGLPLHVVAVLAAFSIAPAGGPAVSGDGSVGPTVAEVVDIIRDSGLPFETNAMFTNIEGSLDEVLDLVKRCTEHVAEVAPRVSVVLKLDVREGHPDALHQKVAAVERLHGVAGSARQGAE